jgi:hypothetical protein
MPGGEYTTGFVGGGASGSDKKVGVVGLSLFDLRRRGKVGIEVVVDLRDVTVQVVT